MLAVNRHFIIVVMMLLPIAIPAQDSKSRSAAIDAIASGRQNPELLDPKLRDHQAPKLVIRWQCADCNGNEKLVPLIEKSYERNTQQHHYSVSDAEVVDVLITDYRQRSPGKRITLGAIAGNDVLATKVTFRGQTFIVEDDSTNAWTGMNYLCGSVATKIFKVIIPILKQAPKQTDGS